MAGQRTPDFARDEGYDTLLREMNGWFASIEEELTASVRAPKLPTVFIVGVPRSGSTLLTQLLAASGGFAYPSNLLARFYASLYIGARVEILLRKVLPPVERSYDSDIGRTRQWDAPNEFGFFWAHHFPIEDHHELSAEELASVDTKAFLRELAALEAAYGLPVCMKGMLLNYNLSFLHGLLPLAIFVRMERDHVSVASSLLWSRQRFYGTPRRWLSCRPRNWRELAELEDPAEQVVAQIQSIERALDSAFTAIPGKNQVTIDYKDLCSDPHGQLRRIAHVMAALGHEPSLSYVLPRRFQASREHDRDEDSWRCIRRHCERYGLA